LRQGFLVALLCSSTLTCSSGWANPLYTHFLFFPSRTIKLEPMQIDGVPRQSVKIPVDGQVLSGWYFYKPDSPYVVLVNHGNSGNLTAVQWIAHNLLSAGVSVLLYDYRGYGSSSRRKPDVKSICTDGQAAYRFLTDVKGFKPENIILYGQSLGCAVACDIAKDQNVAGLILQSGFSSLRAVAFQHFPLLHYAPALVPDALDNEAILSHCKLPLLVIHDDKDMIVPFENAKELYGAACGPKWLVVCHKSGHNLYPKSDAIHRSAMHGFIAHVIGNRNQVEVPASSQLSSEPDAPDLAKSSLVAAKENLKASVSSAEEQPVNLTH
jgi:alpha-beta hydrolase superfamily lysophospholipase